MDGRARIRQIRHIQRVDKSSLIDHCQIGPADRRRALEHQAQNDAGAQGESITFVLCKTCKYNLNNKEGPNTMPENENDTLLTIPEVARRLSVDPSTVRHWANNGVLEAVIMPGIQRQFYRIRESVVTRLLQGTPAQPGHTY